MSEEEHPVFKLGEPVDREITGDTGVPLFPFSPQMPPRPAWPLFPFDAECFTETTPRPDVANVVRSVMPDFEPELHPQDWLLAAEWAFASGRTRAEVRAMTYDDIVACFGSQRAKVGTAPIGPSKVTGGEPQPSSPVSKPKKKNVPGILEKMWRDPKGKMQIKDAGSARGISLLIGCSKSSIVEAGYIWDDEIKHVLKSRRVELQVAKAEQRERQQGSRKGRRRR